ncbi:MAG: alpha/beta fold hydrolase [Cyanobacteria bacterium J06614_10]
MSHCPPYFSGFDSLSDSEKSLLMEDARPQWLRAEGTRAEGTANECLEESAAAVVCVHGFTGMPYEVMPVARACAQAGVSAIAPLLPGHGYRALETQKEKFGQITPDGLLDAVREEIARVRQRYEVVGLHGHSMGGAIALILAAEGLVDACAVSAPALRLPWQAELLAPTICRFAFTRPAPTKDPFYLPSYQFYHSYAVRTLWQLSHQSRQRLSEIACPVLGVHSHDDKTVPPVVLDLMERRITAELSTAWFDPSSHAMTLDSCADEVNARIATFFQQCFQKYCRCGHR